MKTTKPRKLTLRQIDKIAREFAMDTRLAARLAMPDIADHVKPLESPLAPAFTIETQAGSLRVQCGRLVDPKLVWLSVDTIFCRFEEPARGVAVFGSTFAHGHVNPYSGKWNHHAFIGPCHGLTDPRDVLVSLQRCWWGFLDGLERLGFDAKIPRELML